MDLFSGIPYFPLILLPVVLVIIVVILVFILRRGKKPQAPIPDSLQDQPLPQEAPISTTPVKSSEGKYLFLIIATIIIAILIPLSAIYFVKNQSIKTPSLQTTKTTPSGPTCNAITITDTLDAPLSETALTKLRPGDEVKILITTTGESLDKARFRINGSQWQEITIKQANNYIGNYILGTGFKKFIIEAEVHDKDKGWL